jgi:dTDP-4-amino-4,6-dideoxygalactose transaminase
MNGYKPIFYKVNADYTGNENDVESKLEDGCLFLYMPYFGIKPFKEKTLKKWKKERHIVLIEDTTQNALHKQKRSCADITVSSIRQWLSLPDGGLLWGDVQHIGEHETAFSEMRKQAMQLKSEYLKKGEDNLKQRYRKILDEAAISLDGQAEPFAMTEESARLLSTIKLDQILKKRKGNVRALKRGLKSLEKQGKIRYLTKTPTKSTLYFPIIVERRDELQKTLAENRIYCPVIWPLPEGAQGVCAISEYTAEYMLALPCDQRYGKKDMKYISKTLKKILGE